MRVLVTGATGLVGGALARRLAARGDDVTVFQRRPSGLPVREVLGSVADRTAVDAAVAGMDVVIHAAAKVAVVGAWSSYVETNILGTRNMLEAARAAGVGRFVHVSSPSAAHYGTSLVGAPATPADPELAHGNYSRSKAEAELLALAANTDGFAVVVVRPHCVWGPGDTQLVGRVVSHAREGRLAIIGSGGALIDTTYVDNAADALIAAADHAAELGGRVFVVSNGQPRPVGELFNRIAVAAGFEPPRRRIPPPVARALGTVLEFAWERLHREGEPPITRFVAEQLSTAHWFDQRETRAALHWQPAVSLDAGFTQLVEWLQASQPGTAEPRSRVAAAPRRFRSGDAHALRTRRRRSVQSGD